MDRDYQHDLRFTRFQHLGDCCMLGAEAEAGSGVNTHARVNTSGGRDEGRAYFTRDAPFARSERTHDCARCRD